MESFHGIVFHEIAFFFNKWNQMVYIIVPFIGKLNYQLPRSLCTQLTSGSESVLPAVF